MGPQRENSRTEAWKTQTGAACKQPHTSQKTTVRDPRIKWSRHEPERHPETSGGPGPYTDSKGEGPSEVTSAVGGGPQDPGVIGQGHPRGIVLPHSISPENNPKETSTCKLCGILQDTWPRSSSMSESGKAARWILL